MVAAVTVYVPASDTDTWPLYLTAMLSSSVPTNPVTTGSGTVFGVPSYSNMPSCRVTVTLLFVTVRVPNTLVMS